MIVQRTLAARSISHAQGGTLFAGYLKLLPIFLLVIPGMISRVLFTGNSHIILVYFVHFYIFLRRANRLALGQVVQVH